MKLGITYMVFDGFDLLKFAASSIRNQVDHISVTYQTTSYFGNQCDLELIPTLEYLKSQNLIDELVYYEPDLSVAPKENEVRLRNIGLNISRKNNCTHHISADVDEFHRSDQLEYAKKIIDNENCDFSICESMTYYKDPTYLVVPDPKILIPFIHNVDNEYDRNISYPEFPFQVEKTRQLSKCKKYKLFSKEEMVIHHMSYVRKDIGKKLNNSSNKYFYKIDKFLKSFENYKVGNRVCIAPDFINRKTILVDNIFNIKF